jgi:hypothetical protein
VGLLLVNFWQFADAHPVVSIIAIGASAFAVTFVVEQVASTVRAFAGPRLRIISATAKVEVEAEREEEEDEEEDEDQSPPGVGGAEQPS